MDESVKESLEFFMLLGELKRTQRTGWVNNNISHAESVADHMYRMSMMSMLVNDKNVDQTRCMKMCLVHDLGEAIIGDITPFCGVSDEEKYEREKNAIDKICALIKIQKVADETRDLWHEYEAQETAESKVVKDLDRFDMILQAYEYEKVENRAGELQSFFNGTKGKFQTDTVKTWVEELDNMRAQTIKDKDGAETK